MPPSLCATVQGRRAGTFGGAKQPPGRDLGQVHVGEGTCGIGFLSMGGKVCLHIYQMVGGR
jgi:hypothetical protein